MDRKEAIEILNNLRNFYANRQFGRQEAEALDVALTSLLTDEAYQLEYEQTTKNDLGVDCISRAEVIEEINSVANDAWDEEQMRVDLIAEINALPSVTPQEPILDKIYADIQRLRGCSCSCSDGIIDDIEDILDKYKAEIEPQESEDNNVT